MTEDLRKRIKEDLAKTGFGSEMVAAKLFLDAKWGCQSGSSYLDLDENKTREIDISAHLARGDIFKSPNVFYEYIIQAEVKKSERPWIVFSSNTNFPPEGVWVNHHFELNLPCSLVSLDKIFFDTSLRKSIPWVGHGVHESFKEPTQASRWHSAATTACKACTSAFRFDEDFNETVGCNSLLFQATPVVILDGILVRAWLDDSSEIQIEEIHEAPMSFDFGSAGHKRQTFRLDLVTITGLPNYISRATDRVKRVFDELVKGKQSCP